ncbi:MAG: hypothetical protein AAF098_16645 [Pseudomonadota bacterium]
MLTILHIEKSAGTSIREYLYTTFGRNAVFWWGIDAPIASNRADLQSGKYIVGGHRALHQYSNLVDRAFIATLRDPVERAVSFYSYICRQEIVDWKRDGFDPHDFFHTLKHCERFRDAITNRQTWYFARERSFAEAQNLILSGGFLLGTVASVDHILHAISAYMGVDFEPAPRVNQGPLDYRNSMNINEAALSEIESLNIEDRKLFDMIHKQSNSLVNTVSDDWWSGFRSRINVVYQRARLMIVEVHHEIHGHERLELDLLLMPGNDLPMRKEDSLFVGVRADVYEENSKHSIERRAPVAKGYFRGEPTFYHIVIPVSLSDGRYNLTPGLVDVSEKQWLKPDQLQVASLSLGYGSHQR